MPETCRLDNLKVRREAAGFTVTQLAAAALVSDLTIVVLEQTPTPGACRSWEAERIADALGVSLAMLGQAPL